MTNNSRKLCGEGQNCEEVSSLTQKHEKKIYSREQSRQMKFSNKLVLTLKAKVENIEVGGAIKVTIKTAKTTTIKM